jgi:hypothetical protein
MALAVRNIMQNDNEQGTIRTVERRTHERKGWRATWLGLVTGRMWYLVAFSDTTQTRFFLGITALLWALALIMPGDSFSRPTFAYMSMLAGDNAEEKWTAAFALYAVLDIWLVFYYVRTKYVSFLVNVFGVLLFTSVAYAVGTLSGEPFPAGVAAHCGVALAAVWVLIRTHVNSPVGWRHD